MKKNIFIISHISLIILILLINFYGNLTFQESGNAYTVDDNFIDNINKQLIIKRTLGALLLINFIISISYVFLYSKQYKWLYLILVIEIILFACTLLIYYYSFMFI